MSIAHPEVMSEVAPVEIRTKYETVLIYFVWIVWYETDSCSESVLGNYIPFNQLRPHELLLRFYLLLSRC